MRRALIVSVDELILDVNIRLINSLGLKDLALFGAKNKDKALEHLVCGDYDFVLLDEEVRDGKLIAEHAKKIGSKLMILTQPSTKMRTSILYSEYSPVYLEKPDYFLKLEKEIAKVYLPII